VIQGAAAILIALSMSGCISGSVVSKSSEKSADTFFISSIYQSTNTQDVVLEGKVRPRGKPWDWREPSGTNAYLAIGHEHIGPEPFPTNSLKAQDRLRKCAPAIAKYSRIETDLPAGYAKIIGWPPGGPPVDIHVSHPKRALLALLPLTIAADAATLPLQAIGILLLLSIRHGC